MVEVIFRLAEDIADVSGARIQQLINLDYAVVPSPEHYLVRVHNLDVGPDDPQEYGSVTLSKDTR